MTKIGNTFSCDILIPEWISQIVATLTAMPILLFFIYFFHNSICSSIYCLLRIFSVVHLVSCFFIPIAFYIQGKVKQALFILTYMLGTIGIHIYYSYMVNPIYTHIVLPMLIWYLL